MYQFGQYPEHMSSRVEYTRKPYCAANSSMASRTPKFAVPWRTKEAEGCRKDGVLQMRKIVKVRGAYHGHVAVVVVVAGHQPTGL